MKILSDRIKELRKKRAITQMQIAELLNISQATYNGYENNKHNPDIETLIKIADILQTSTDYLLGRYN